MDVSEGELQDLYTWVDEIPLSRPKRNIARDFSDGVLMAEIVHHYFPKIVELHNYSGANATTQKMYNWNTLNQKVFKRLGFTLSKPEFEAASNCQPGCIERILKLVRTRINRCREEGFTGNTMSPTMIPAGAAVVSTVTRPANPPAYGAPDQGYGTKDMGGYIPAVPAARPPVMNNSPPMAAPVPGAKHGKALIPQEVLADREQIIGELRETNEILETKVRKLEQLVRLKDAKISTLMARLQSANLV